MFYGAYYGLTQGMPAVLCATMLGACANYYMSRDCVRPRLEALYGPDYAAFKHKVLSSNSALNLSKAYLGANDLYVCVSLLSISSTDWEEKRKGLLVHLVTDPLTVWTKRFHHICLRTGGSSSVTVGLHDSHWYTNRISLIEKETYTILSQKNIWWAIKGWQMATLIDVVDTI